MYFKFILMHEWLFWNSFEMKVVGRNDILEISGFKKSFSYKGFSNYSKLFSWFPRQEVTTLLKLMKTEV
jgi:hypothetical protein